MVLQAFMDESFTEGRTFVLAGYIASVEQWLAFTGEWEPMLPYATLNKNGAHQFKMSQMAVTDERLSRVPAFYRIIERHVPLALSFSVDMRDIQRATERLSIPGVPIHWELIRNPYNIAFYGLLTAFHGHRPSLASVGCLPLEEKVDFIFDDRSEKGAIHQAWDGFVASRRDEARRFYGATPRFENDEEFLPLQAADLWAWWVRKWSEDGTPENIDPADFGSWQEKVAIPKLTMNIDEESLVRNLKMQLKQLAPDRTVIDSAS